MERYPWEQWFEDLQERRQERVRRMAERTESVPLWNEVVRVLYITAAILFDGLVVGELLVLLEDPWRWPTFFAVLAVVVWAQYRVYRRFWPRGWDA